MSFTTRKRRVWRQEEEGEEDRFVLVDRGFQILLCKVTNEFTNTKKKDGNEGFISEKKMR